MNSSKEIDLYTVSKDEYIALFKKDKYQFKCKTNSFITKHSLTLDYILVDITLEGKTLGADLRKGCNYFAKQVKMLTEVLELHCSQDDQFSRIISAYMEMLCTAKKILITHKERVLSEHLAHDYSKHRKTEQANSYIHIGQHDSMHSNAEHVNSYDHTGHANGEIDLITISKEDYRDILQDNPSLFISLTVNFLEDIQDHLALFPLDVNIQSLTEQAQGKDICQ